MPKSSFQIKTLKTSSPFYPMCRDLIRQLTWSATLEHFCCCSTWSFIFDMLSPLFNILIDSALTFYWSQFIVLSSTELSVASSSLKTKSFMRIKETQLMADENTSLIHICLQNQSAYGLTSEDTYFWKKVRLSFAKETKQDYTKPKRHVSDLIQKRKIHLRMLKTGDKNQKTTYTKAIDDWIKVINTHTDKKTRKKQTAKEEARKIQTTEKT